MLKLSYVRPGAKLANGLRGSRMTRSGLGQSAVEFALIAPVALVLMIVGVQYAIIGQAALAVSQGASAIARYASVNPGTVGGSSGNGSITLNGSAMQQLLSPTICGGSCSDLTATITSISSTTGTPNTAGNPPTFGDRLTINLSYNATSKIVLPSTTLLGITFPTTLAGSAAQLYE